MTTSTRLLVLDHITSPSALVLPAAAIIEAARARGIPVLVDGAHAPGQIALDIEALGADWYVGNCHKWLMAPKGCGFLWARPARQARLRPLAVSHFHDDGFVAAFDWTGTSDPSAFLAVVEAIAFHERLGGDALRARNAALAHEAARIVADGVGGEGVAHPALHAAMSLVALPGGGDERDALALRERLYALGTDAPVASLSGRLWVRLSAQAYNEAADYGRLVPFIQGALNQMEG